MNQPRPEVPRPFRSVLYIPGANQRALEKAASLPCDAIIFDLEDAVAPEEKARARALVAEMLRTTDYGHRARIVRINALETEWGRADCLAFAETRPDAILVPKVSRPAHVEAVATLVPDLPLWAMMETAVVAWHAADIAAHPRIEGFVVGTNDLAKDIGARFRPDREPLLTAMSLCLLAGKAYGRIVVDGVYNAFKDDEGLKVECNQGRDMGFDGKTLIHPAQIAVANEVFAPSEGELDLARRQIAAHAEAERAGRGVAVVDGRIVERLHVVGAERIIARAAAIAASGG
ncbi:MAG: CoA ester lyase [Proteobacteria bacterium]|nr:CoA ester lyase [Pseudomonadota bacterium]MBS0574251.1 CoA ester lyase [Pseudomonadota bacterium]